MSLLLKEGSINGNEDTGRRAVAVGAQQCAKPWVPSAVPMKEREWYMCKYHLGGRGRRIGSPRSPLATEQFGASLSFL